MIQMGHPYIAHPPGGVGDIFVRPKRVDNNIEFRIVGPDNQMTAIMTHDELKRMYSEIKEMMEQ